MGYRKFSANYLFSGEKIITGAVLIVRGSGEVEAVVAPEDAGGDIEKFEGLITPGFVNTHCHLELSHMRGRIPPGTGLTSFLTRVIKERNFPEYEVFDAMQHAVKEMYDGGIVAVGDICNTTDTISSKERSTIRWHNFIEVIGFAADQATGRFEFAAQVAEKFRMQLPQGSLHTSLSPHAPYSVSETLFGLINNAAPGKTITIHNQESKAENELYLHKSGELLEFYAGLNINATLFKASGKSSLQTYLPWLDNASQLLLVHNTCTTEEDLLFAESRDSYPHRLFFCVCINANRYITGMMPPIGLLRKNNCTITLGTDSYASNRQLSILEEMKTLQYAFDIPLEEMLQWATINGARALKMDDELGSFSPGRQPGVVLIDKIRDGAIAPDAVATRLL